MYRICLCRCNHSVSEDEDFLDFQTNKKSVDMSHNPINWHEISKLLKPINCQGHSIVFKDLIDNPLSRTQRKQRSEDRKDNKNSKIRTHKDRSLNSKERCPSP